MPGDDRFAPGCVGIFELGMTVAEKRPEEAGETCDERDQTGNTPRRRMPCHVRSL
jgi:hypothetical protein